MINQNKSGENWKNAAAWLGKKMISTLTVEPEFILDQFVMK